MLNWFDNLPTDGGTFTKDGKQIFRTEGYYVSITNNVIPNIDQSTIDKLVDNAENMGLSNYYLGYWLDAMTGKKYLDISLYVKSKKRALWLASIHDQQAIWDIKNMNSIYLEDNIHDIEHTA